ncbi:hypothetical protein ACJX0J_013229, partial [Zea mays]
VCLVWSKLAGEGAAKFVVVVVAAACSNFLLDKEINVNAHIAYSNNEILVLCCILVKMYAGW